MSAQVDRGFESHPLRQLGNVFVGSPSARARQQFLSIEMEATIILTMILSKD